MKHHILCPAEREWEPDLCQCNLLRAEDEQCARIVERIGKAYGWRSSEKEMIKKVANEIRER